jgi:hypothetical protein
MLPLPPRPPTSRLQGFAWLLGFAAFAFARSALAEDVSPEDRASARALGIEGVRLAESGDCPSAIPKFEAAEKLFHAPSTLERLGECQIKIGRLVAGTENLNRVVREALPANAPAPFVQAQASAARLLESTAPRIARLRIHVEGAPKERVAVTVDGIAVSSVLFDADRPTDPGAHEIIATADGYKKKSVTVRLGEGAAQTASLVLEPQTTAVATPSVQIAPATPPAPEQAAAAPSHTAAFVALGVGAAGLAVGSIFGALALGTKSSLDNACTNKACPASSQGDIDSLSTQAWIANVGFGVGIVGAVTGTVLWLTAGSSKPGPARQGARFVPWVGIGTAGVGGTFQ